MKLILILLSLSVLSFNAFAINCGGTEPFWDAQVSNDKIILSSNLTGDSSKTNISVNSITGAAGYLKNFLQVYSNSNGPVAVLKTNSCSNGMSPLKYAQEIVIFTGTTTLYGCCGKGVE